MLINRLLQMGFLREGEGDGGDGGDGGGGGGSVPPLLNDDLTFTEGYQDRIGEHAQGATYKDLPSVFKSARESRQTISTLGEEKVALTKEIEALKAAGPKSYESPEALQKEIALPENLPEGIQLPPKLVEEVAKFAHEKNIPPEHVSSFIEFQTLRAKGELDSLNTESHTLIEAAKAQIASVVGPQEYEGTIARAKEASEILGLELDEETLVTTPNLVVNLSKLKSKVSEDALRSAGFETVTKSQAGSLSQAEDIVSNEKNPLNKAFWDATDPRHDEARAEHSRLIADSGTA